MFGNPCTRRFPIRVISVIRRKKPASPGSARLRTPSPADDSTIQPFNEARFYAWQASAGLSSITRCLGPKRWTSLCFDSSTSDWPIHFWIQSCRFSAATNSLFPPLFACQSSFFGGAGRERGFFCRCYSSFLRSEMASSSTRSNTRSRDPDLICNWRASMNWSDAVKAGACLLPIPQAGLRRLSWPTSFIGGLGGSCCL